MTAGPRRAESAAILAAHGLLPGPDGYDPAELEAFAAARGWQTTVERRPSSGPPRYRALGFAAGEPAGPALTGLRAFRGSGRTPGEALAQCLARILAGEGEGD